MAGMFHNHDDYPDQDEQITMALDAFSPTELREMVNIFREMDPEGFGYAMDDMLMAQIPDDVKHIKPAGGMGDAG